MESFNNCFFFVRDKRRYLSGLLTVLLSGTQNLKNVIISMFSG